MNLKEKKLRDAYARCYYQQGVFGDKVFEDINASVVLTQGEIAEYRRGLAPYSKAQIRRHIKDFEVARVVATDAYVTGAAIVEIIHGADMIVSVCGGYSTLCTRLAEGNIARYDIYDVEEKEILEDKYNRMGDIQAQIKAIKRIDFEDNFLDKIRFTKKCFCDLTGVTELDTVRQIGERLQYDSAVVFCYSGDYFTLERLISEWNFRIYEYSTGKELENRFFHRGSIGIPQYQLSLEEDFCLVLAVKKR